MVNIVKRKLMLRSCYGNIDQAEYKYGVLWVTFP
jgi:hypothetical protein